jgi:ribosomal protein S18 acetylase RimI-like enzyme
VTPEPVVDDLQPDDLVAASEVLARAFRDNPGMCAVLGGDETERLRMLQKLAPAFVECYRRHGRAQVVRAGRRIVAVALWQRPASHPVTWRMQWLLTVAVVRHMPLAVALRLDAIDRWMKSHHPRTEHVYLFMLGVDPEQQGMGHGSRLLRGLQQVADERGAPCYLETDTAGGVRLYQRNGYAILREETSRRLADLKLWFMQTEARTPRS